MEEINYTYNLKLKVLTPLFIGAGKEKDWVRGFDFIIFNGSLYVFNQEKLFKFLDKENLLEKYTNIISQNNTEKIEVFFRENFNDQKLDDISEIIDENCENISSEIKSFIRDGMGRAFIPGSSIKGAIRSVLFNYVYSNHQQDIVVLSNRDQKKYINVAIGDFDKSIMRFIKPYDIYGIDDYLAIANVKLYNVKHPDNNIRSENKEIGITIECIYPFDDIIDFDFTIKIAEPFLEIIKNNYKYDTSIPKYKDEVFKNSKNKTILHLFNIINKYTRKHIQKEIEFFEKYTHSEGIHNNIISKLKDLQKRTVNNNRSCILRMSYGSGFHGITGDWQFDEHSIDDIRSERGKSVAYYNRKRTAKSRRVINNKYLLGFVELILPDNVCKKNP
jgi:CRISPR type III-A-associated RAMP protein Csm5